MKLHWHRRAIVVLAVLGSTLLLGLVLATGRGLQERIPTAYEHLEEFQTLADEHGDRATGTSGYEAAAQYVEQQLDSAGYQSTRQYFTFEHRGDKIESFNIIAETDGGSDNNVIMLGAHLDGVPNSPAINDNASGAAALLVAANELSRQPGPNNKVRFAWWGAEEFPTSEGSKHYVDDLAENDSGELDNIAAYLNFDMAASPNHVIAVYDARQYENSQDLDDGPQTLKVPAGSVAIMDFFTDYFDNRGQRWVTTHWDFNSDQVAFRERDVAVGGLFTGSGERKSARRANLFGGTAGQPHDPNYHTPGDDISNVSREALNLTTEAITHAATSLAVDSSTLQ